MSFSLDGTNYEIDLNEKHIDGLRGTLMPYIQAARKAAGGAPARRQTSAVPKRSRQDLGEIRAWLQSNGYPVKERGRIPNAWVADFEAKTPNPPQRVVSEAPAEAEQSKSKQSKSKGPAVETPVFQEAG